MSGVLDHEPGQGSNMDNKMIVTCGRGKRPGHCSFSQVILINFYKRVIIIILNINILYDPSKYVEKLFQMNIATGK